MHGASPTPQTRTHPQREERRLSTYVDPRRSPPGLLVLSTILESFSVCDSFSTIYRPRSYLCRHVACATAFNSAILISSGLPGKSCQHRLSSIGKCMAEVGVTRTASSGRGAASERMSMTRLNQPSSRYIRSFHPRTCLHAHTPRSFPPRSFVLPLNRMLHSLALQPSPYAKVVAFASPRNSRTWCRPVAPPSHRNMHR